MYSTKLSTILNRMNRYQTISTIEEQYKVADLDEAIRSLNQEIKTPWSLKKGALRVFNDVLTYPVASDHDELAFLENPHKNNGSNRADFFYTSIKEFYADNNNRNNLCEIWDNGTKYLGVRYNASNVGSALVNTSKIVANYTASGDASDIYSDTVNFKDSEGNNSIRFLNTVNSGVATVDASFTSMSGSNYKKKYFFLWVYLSGTPTSVDVKFGNDSSNYLSANVTTQFSGQAFNTNNWNLIAIDLNTSITSGIIDSDSFSYFSLDFNDAPAGYYNIDNGYLRQWTSLDYWYYTENNVKTNSSSVADQGYFINDTTETYSTDSALVGDKEWADVIMYDAMTIGLSDEKDGSLFSVIQAKRNNAWKLFLAKYPDLVPLIITTKYNFETNYNINDSLR